MLSCLKVLGMAASALRDGDAAEGQRILGLVHDCAKRDVCASRHVCLTAAAGVSRSVPPSNGAAMTL
jgi:hypothetical protein